MIVLQSSSFPGRVKKRETARDRPNLSCRNMPRRPVLCLGVAVALFTAKILCFVQTAKFQPKRPDRRHHVCMSANEFVNMAQTILGVTTFDENVTKVALAIMEKEMEKGMAIMEKEKEKEKGMAIMEKEKEKGMAIMEKGHPGEGDGEGEGHPGEGDGEGDGYHGEGEGDGYHGEGEGEGHPGEGDGEGDGSQGDGEGDGSQGDGDGEQCSGQIQTFAIQIFVREFQVLVGTAFLRLPKVCPEQILVEKGAKYDKHQQIFGKQRRGLATICCQRELIFDAACE